MVWPKVAAVVVALLLLLVITFAVVRIAMESDHQNCIADATARYPVEVVPTDSPLGATARVSGEKDRVAALDRCQDELF